MAFPETDETIERQVPWLPGERFELAMDSRTGLSTTPIPGEQVLNITTRRATKLGQETGKRTTSMVPLDQVTAVEVLDVERPKERLAQGLIILAAGILFGAISHVVLAQQIITLLVGGLPILVAIYMLAGYFFPDSEGELVLHTGAFTVRQPLRTREARRDAYLAAHRIYDLMVEARSGRTASTIERTPSARDSAAAVESPEPSPEIPASPAPYHDRGQQPAWEPRPASIAPAKENSAYGNGAPWQAPAQRPQPEPWEPYRPNVRPSEPPAPRPQQYEPPIREHRGWEPSPSVGNVPRTPAPEPRREPIIMPPVAEPAPRSAQEYREPQPPAKPEPRWSAAWAPTEAGSDASESSVRAHFAQGTWRADPPGVDRQAAEEAYREEHVPAAERAMEEDGQEQQAPERRE